MANIMANLTKTRLMEIGKEEGLKGRTLADYVAFYAKRFPKNLMVCETGYEREWAQRFAMGGEWGKADFESRRALQSANPDKYKGSINTLIL